MLGYQQILSTVVGPVTVRSNLNADRPVTFEPFGDDPSEQPDGPGWLMRVLKPEVTVSLPTGPYTWAPAGQPSANYAPLIVAGLGGLAFSVFGLGSLFGRFTSMPVIAAVGVAGGLALAMVASETTFENKGEA